MHSLSLSLRWREKLRPLVATRYNLMLDNRRAYVNHVVRTRERERERLLARLSINTTRWRPSSGEQGGTWRFYRYSLGRASFVEVRGWI